MIRFNYWSMAKFDVRMNYEHIHFMQFRLLVCPESLLFPFDMKNIQIKIKRMLVYYGCGTWFLTLTL